MAVSRAVAFSMLLFLLSIAVLLPSHVSMTKAEPNIVRVPGDYSTIQEAIDAAQNGSTILVSSGVYYEHLTVNKTLTFLGADEEDTIIDGSNGSDVVVITADNVRLDGFTVRNSLGTGISLVDSTDSIVSDNVVTLNAWSGIQLSGSSNDTVSDNIISWTIGSTEGVIFGKESGFASRQRTTS